MIAKYWKCIKIPESEATYWELGKAYLEVRIEGQGKPFLYDDEGDRRPPIASMNKKSDYPTFEFIEPDVLKEIYDTL